MALRRVILCGLALLAGCSSPTAIVIDLARGADDALPRTLTASIFDPHHALVTAIAVATHVPGRFVVTNLPATTIPLRFAFDGNGTTLEAGVAVTIVPGAVTHAAATLAAATPDRDRDGVPDIIDNCPDVANPSQASNDGREGDACRAAVDLGIDLAAPPGSDLAPGGDLAGTIACPAAATFCDSFDSPFGSVWGSEVSPGSTSGVDAIHVLHGSAAAHFHVSTTNSGYLQDLIGESKSQPLADTYVRVYVYVPSATEPFNAGLIDLYESNAAPYGDVMLSIDPGGHLELTDTVAPGFDVSSTSQFPTNRWVCLEWHFHETPPSPDQGGQSATSQVWLDGISVPELNVNMGLRSPSAFDDLHLGLTMNTSGGGDVWYDDFAVGPSRIGCE